MSKADNLVGRLVSEEALTRSYKIFYPWSEEYRVDSKRFKFSLDLLDKMGLIENKKILDVGSGIGLMVSALNLLGGRAVGIDRFIFGHNQNNFYQIGDLEKLSKIWENNKISIIDGDALSPLPFPDQYFDLVISDAFIEHLPESPRRLFKEVHRVLRTSGHFLVTTPNVATLQKRLRFLLLGRSPHWDLKDYFDRGPDFLGHRREFSLDEVVRMLEWSGFKEDGRFSSNAFFNPHRFLSRQKFLPQFFAVLSRPFLSLREMLYVMGKKI